MSGTASQIDAMVARTIERFGRVDILINNAGALWWQPVLETPAKRFDLVMGVNARAAFLASRAVLPHMIERRWGHIINMSPPIDLKVVPGKVAYFISKFGMTLISHGLAEEVPRFKHRRQFALASDHRGEPGIHQLGHGFEGAVAEARYPG